MRNQIVVLAGLAVVAGLRIASPGGDPVIPMIAIDQGVTSHLVAGAPVLISREGSVITAFSPVTPGASRDRLVYCPREKIFVSPARKVMFNAAGEHVAGESPRDMDRYEAEVTDDLEVRVDTGNVLKRKRSKGTVPGEVGNAFYDWAAAPDKPAGFCRDPIRA